MKKYLLIALCTLAFMGHTLAQNCNPDVTITSPGVYPDQPDTAYADVPYEFVFQILALKDTNTTFGGQPVTAEIDSVKVNSVIGLPTSFDYSCDPPSCNFTYENVGCIKLSGNPINSQAGLYDIKIATTAYARIGNFKIPQADTADDYFLVVVGNASVPKPPTVGVSLYPNPSLTGSYVVKSEKPIVLSKVTDYQGKEVTVAIFNTQKGLELNLSKLPKGVYFINLEVDNKTLVQKIIW